MDKHTATNDVEKAKAAVKDTVAIFTGDRDTQVKVTPDKIDGVISPKVDGAKNAEK